MESVRVQVKDVREGAERVNFVVLEGVKVEANSLQVNDQNIGRLGNHSSLLKVNFPRAAITVVVIDNLTFDQLLK